MTSDTSLTADGVGASATLATIEAEVAGYAHGRVPGALRRRQILAAAEALFVERGFAAASMDELARRVGVSKPVIYEHLGGKDAVFETCVARVADDLATTVAAAVVAAGDDDAARLHAGALAWFRFIADRRQLWYSLLASGDGPVSDAIDGIRARQNDFVAAQLLATAAREGIAIDPELAEGIAMSMNGAFEALGRWWGDHPHYRAEQLADLFSAMVAPGLRDIVGWRV